MQIVDAAELYSPGFRDRDAPTGRRPRTAGARPDGIHLDERGAEMLTGRLLGRLRRDFTLDG